MRLLEVDENHNVRPNKEWLILIPEFAALYKRDKGSPGDVDGRKKLRFKKEVAFIYFHVGFTSPLRDWQPSEKLAEALNYASIKEDEIDDVINAASAKYEELQLKSSRSYRTYLAMKRGLDSMDTYYETIDFTKVDKKGELVHSTTGYTRSVIEMNKVYDSLAAFEKRVENDLKDADGGIRGQATLGDLEARKTAANHNWKEEDIRVGSERAKEGAVMKSVSWTDMQKVIAAKVTPNKPLNEDELSQSG